MGIDQVIGQEQIKDYIKKAVKKSKVSHAYILCGEKGTGRMALAKLFAASLQCMGNTGAEDFKGPCGECRSCRQMQSGNQPDVITVTQEKKTGIGIDEIRYQVNNSVTVKPYAGPYKVYIIPNADKMTEQAQNALLKTIEEPPAYGIVIFLTTNADIFLQTIISRCVLLDLKPLKESVVMDYLKDNYDVSEYERKFAADFAQGKIGRAKTIIEGTEFAHLKNNVMHVIKNVKDMTAADIMAVVKDVTNYKLTIDDYLDLMAMWFRDVLMFKSTNDTNYLIFSDEISLIKSQAEVMSYEGIQDILNSIDKVKVRLKANVNFDLCIELLIMAMKEDM